MSARIYMLHRVLPVYDADNYYFQRQTAISWSRFIRLLDEIKSNGWTTHPVSKLTSGASETDVFITFDDGYVDNNKALSEILRRGMIATLFPVKDFIQHNFSVIDDMAHHLMQHNALRPLPQSLQSSLQIGRLKKLLRNLTPTRYRLLRGKWFNIHHDADTARLFMTELEIIYLCQQGIELGMHGSSHRTFNSLSHTVLNTELIESQKWLKGLGSSPCPPICFPHGKHNQKVIDISLNFGQPLVGVDCKVQYQQVFRRIHYMENHNE